MTEDEWLIHQERKRAALEGAEETRADLARRQQARAEGREREWVVPQQPDLRSMHQEAPHKREERRIVETRALVDSRVGTAVAQFSGEITKAVGQAIAIERRDRRKEAEALCDVIADEVRAINKWRAEIAASQALLEKRIASLQKRLVKAEKAAEKAAAPAPRMLPHVA